MERGYNETHLEEINIYYDVTPQAQEHSTPNTERIANSEKERQIASGSKMLDFSDFKIEEECIQSTNDNIITLNKSSGFQCYNEESEMGNQQLHEKSMQKEISSPRCLIKEHNILEELVYSILSLLPLREAVRTSILCKKYRRLWKTWFNLDLNLDYKTMAGISSDSSINLDEKTKLYNYMEWADKKMFEFTDEKIISCKIAYPMGQGRFYHRFIDEWFRNLASKRVEELNIDFTCTNGKLKLPQKFQLYSFDYDLFPQNNYLQHLSLDGCYFHLPALTVTTAAQTTFSNLVSLSLGHMLIRHVDLIVVISTCLSLEHFSISYCLCPHLITISHPPIALSPYPTRSNYLKLKHFEIISCDHYLAGKELILEIYGAVNLQSVAIFGGIYKTILESSAQPYKLQFGFDNSSPPLVEQSLNYAFGELPLAFPQIEDLSLSLTNIKDNTVPKQMNTFSRLTALDLDMYTGASPRSMFEVTSSILKASPLLHRFVIHLPVDILMREEIDGLVGGIMALNLEEEEFSFRHERLTDVKIDNFTGVQIQVDYVILFLDDVINLKKMQICRFCQRNGKCKEDEPRLNIKVKQVNDIFAGKIPKGMQLLVL